MRKTCHEIEAIERICAKNNGYAVDLNKATDTKDECEHSDLTHLPFCKRVRSRALPLDVRGLRCGD